MGSDAAIKLRKSLLILGVSCNIFASTLDFKDMSDDIGVTGGGFVITILAMVLCLVPGIVLEALAWRWAYLLPANTIPAAHPQGLPEVADLPNLVGAKQPESDLPKTQRDDVEAVTRVCLQLDPGREQTQV